GRPRRARRDRRYTGGCRRGAAPIGLACMSDEDDELDEEEEQEEEVEETLAELLGTPMERRLAGAILDPICRQLAATVARGQMQGGLEPDRILVEEVPGRWRPRVEVVDFGKAPADPTYSAPERGGPHGPAADVYSLGVIAHEMLAGAWPEPGATPP